MMGPALPLKGYFRSSKATMLRTSICVDIPIATTLKDVLIHCHLTKPFIPALPIFVGQGRVFIIFIFIYLFISQCAYSELVCNDCDDES